MSIKLCVFFLKFFIEIFCTKTQGPLNMAIIRDSSVIWKQCVCAHVGVWLCVLWSDMMKTKNYLDVSSMQSGWSDLHLLFCSVLKKPVCMCEYMHKSWHQTPDRLTDKSRGHWASGAAAAAAPLLQDPTSAAFKKTRTVGLSTISMVPAEWSDLHTPLKNTLGMCEVIM